MKYIKYGTGFLIDADMMDYFIEHFPKMVKQLDDGIDEFAERVRFPKYRGKANGCEQHKADQ